MKRTLYLVASGAWFQLGDEASMLSARRRALRLLLVALARAHPDPIGSAELVAAGWPDENLAESSAQNRLHVSIHALRRLGLEVIKTPRGYGLDPALRVEWVNES